MPVSFLFICLFYLEYRMTKGSKGRGREVGEKGQSRGRGSSSSEEGRGDSGKRGRRC